MDVREVAGRLQVESADSRHTFHPIWLRERCPCAECTDPATGQRLIDGTAIPLDLMVTNATAGDDGTVTVHYSDGHESRFAAAHLTPPAPATSIVPEGAVTWDGRRNGPPEADHGEATASDAGLHDLLSKLATHGFVVVRGAPREMDAVGEFARTIGPIRETNWGVIADVKALPRAFDLTMTPRRLEPHADNPYRDPIPGYVLLHCLVNSARGGDSTMTDGFAVAEALRRDDPAAFDALTRVWPRYRYADDEIVMENQGPLIETDPDGIVRRVRFSNRTDDVAALDPDTLETYYRARRRYAEMVNSDQFMIEFKLEPGDILMMDNYRMLHGRTAYEPGTGERHMRQCYMDKDAVEGRRKILAQQLREAA